MTTVAVVPARAGSKRLPGKNARPFLGRPLITWTIRAALDAGITSVVVTTDGEELADIALNAGALVVRRPAELSLDSSDTLSTIMHAVEGIEADTVILLQPTSPLRTAQDISTCQALHRNTGRSVVSVTQTTAWPFWAMADGALVKADVPEGAVAVSPNGAIYICSRNALGQNAWYQDPVAYVMPADRSVDIDTLHDFQLAEWYASQYRSNVSFRET